MLSEKLTRRSSRWWLLAVAVGLAVAVALSMAFTGDADAKKKKKKQKPNYPPAAALSPYSVKGTGTGTVNQFNNAAASCDTGDSATGGGFEGVDFNTTRIVDSSPYDTINDPAVVDTWNVLYINGANSDPVNALVGCLDAPPKHVP